MERGVARMKNVYLKESSLDTECMQAAVPQKNRVKLRKLGQGIQTRKVGVPRKINTAYQKVIRYRFQGMMNASEEM
jgi:hypothetical protein